VIEGLAVAWRGPHEGNDWRGGRHDRDVTQFCLDWFDTRPLLLRHDRGQLVTTNVVGRVTELQHTAAGLWARCTVDGAGEHAAAIRDGVEAGRLFFSTGANDVAQVGNLYLRWPIVELSLTPLPANPFCVTWPEVHEAPQVGATIALASVPTQELARHVKDSLTQELAQRAAFDQRMSDLSETLQFDGRQGYTVLLRRDPTVGDRTLADRLGMTAAQFDAARELGNVGIVSYALSESVRAEVATIREGVGNGAPYRLAHV